MIDSGQIPDLKGCVTVIYRHTSFTFSVQKGQPSMYLS